MVIKNFETIRKMAREKTAAEKGFISSGLQACEWTLIGRQRALVTVGGGKEERNQKQW